MPFDLVDVGPIKKATTQTITLTSAGLPAGTLSTDYVVLSSVGFAG